MSCVELQGEEVPSFHLLVRDRSPSLCHLHRALHRPAHRNEYHLKIHISIMASFQIQRNQYLLTFSFMSFVVWTSGWECGAGSEPIITQSKGNHWNPGLPSTFRQMALVSGVTSNSSLPFYRASGSLNFFFYFKVSLAIFSINLCSPLVFIRVWSKNALTRQYISSKIRFFVFVLSFEAT